MYIYIPTKIDLTAGPITFIADKVFFDKDMRAVGKETHFMFEYVSEEYLYKILFKRYPIYNAFKYSIRKEWFTFYELYDEKSEKLSQLVVKRGFDDSDEEYPPDNLFKKSEEALDKFIKDLEEGGSF